ncbi:hypothetical protein KUV51_21730 [Tateyamaria omphalii]|uniref:hypothetical protein n=1 Tax=Tateyamaria omphalii TaxID=299262 RepID=UPI001C9A097A|nr:hypothetical protein [Tateyamaria omphalii]MBY5935645.1 hypothetical protein [Tateyamaria omphalii]
MGTRSTGKDSALHMVQYLCGMFVLLSCALATALVLRPAEELVRPLACSDVALYPVERLAARGDVGAMAYLGTRLAEDRCDVQAQARGVAYLEQAADAGDVAASRVLAAHEMRAASPVPTCAALLVMMMPGVDDAHQIPGACNGL